MCLELKSNDLELHIADEDITCYKIVELVNRHYYTYYRGTHVVMGKTYNSKLGFDYLGDVSVGLHSFPSLSDTKHFNLNHEGVIVECVIPKGSEYYQGMFRSTSGYTPNYASNCLKYIKRLK